jgi:ribosome-binding factor A
MESKRQSRLASLLQETMSEILIKEGANIYGRNLLVSITQVKVTPDVSVARFYMSTLGASENDAVIKLLNENIPFFRKLLGNQLKNHFRKIPDIEFFYDDSLEYAQKMNELFKKINNENPSSEEK